MKEYIFSYGTLQKEDIQLDLFGRVLLGSADVLRGYKISKVEIKDEKFLIKNEKDQLIAKETKQETDSIKGMVFEITGEELLAGDEYEPAEYRRKKVILGSGKEAWIYVAP